jgi:hypothetical protein
MRRWLNFLPWAAAISIAAFAMAAVYIGLLAGLGPLVVKGRHPMTVAMILPVALGFCLAVGLPIALWFRAGRGWAVTLFLVMVGAVVLLILSAVGKFFHGATGEAAGWMTAIFVFYILPLGLLFLLPALSSLAFVGLPVGALVLFLSGEMKAIRQGVSVLDLRHGPLRVGVLAALTAAPALAYAPLPTSSLEAADDGCRTAPPSALQYQGLNVAVDLDKPDWPELKRIAERFAASHDLRLMPPDLFKGNDPYRYRLCAPGKFAFSVDTVEDRGQKNVVFEPSGDRYVSISAVSAPLDERAPGVLREFLTAIDARWLGVRLQTRMDLGPSLRPEWPQTGACRARVARREYQDCLGTAAPSTVRKEALYVHGATSQTQRLQEVMRTFAAAHGMAFTADKTAIAIGRACTRDKALIYADSFADLKPPVRQPGQWHVEIDTYLADERDGPLIDALVATLGAEWPGVMRSRPDIDFCPAMKGGR